VILKSKTVEPQERLHYFLSLPTSIVITGIDSQRVLDQAFEAAKSFHLMDDDDVSAIIGKTAIVGAAGTYELFKTSSHFDTTAKHPDWLVADPPAVQKLAPQNSG
jgi:hypothetical protein